MGRARRLRDDLSGRTGPRSPLAVTGAVPAYVPGGTRGPRTYPVAHAVPSPRTAARTGQPQAGPLHREHHLPRDQGRSLRGSRSYSERRCRETV